MADITSTLAMDAESDDSDADSQGKPVVEIKTLFLQQSHNTHITQKRTKKTQMQKKKTIKKQQ